MDVMNDSTLDLIKRVGQGSVLRIWFISHIPNQWVEARVIENHLATAPATDINRYLRDLGLQDRLNSQIQTFIIVYTGMKLQTQSESNISFNWPKSFTLDINLMWMPSQEKFQPQLRIPIQSFAAFPVKKIEVLS